MPLYFKYCDEDSDLQSITAAEYGREAPNGVVKFRITPGEEPLEDVSVDKYGIYQIIADAADIQVHFIAEEKTLKKAYSIAGALFQMSNGFPPTLITGEEMKMKRSRLSRKKLEDALRFNENLYDEFIILARGRDEKAIVLPLNASIRWRMI